MPSVWAKGATPLRGLHLPGLQLGRHHGARDGSRGSATGKAERTGRRDDRSEHNRRGPDVISDRCVRGSGQSRRPRRSQQVRIRSQGVGSTGNGSTAVA